MSEKKPDIDYVLDVLDGVMSDVETLSRPPIGSGSRSHTYMDTWKRAEALIREWKKRDSRTQDESSPLDNKLSETELHTIEMHAKNMLAVHPKQVDATDKLKLIAEIRRLQVAASERILTITAADFEKFEQQLAPLTKIAELFSKYGFPPDSGDRNEC